MLDTLNTSDAIVSADAIKTQKKIVSKILKNGSDYLLCVKNNNKKLKEETAAYSHKVTHDIPKHIQCHEEIDNGHGRIESCWYRELRMNEWIEEGITWQGIQTIIEITRRQIIKYKEQQQTLYYISSLAPDIVQISDALQGHWEVENKVYWVLDVTFKEGDCRIRKEDGAENVGIIRRFVLNLSRLHPSKISMCRKLKRAARVDGFRTEIIFG